MRQPIRVYRLRADAERFSWLGVERSEMRPLALILEGNSLRDRWVPPIVSRIVDDELPQGELGDYPFLEGAPALSKRAVDALLDVLAESAEFLPLNCDAGEYYVMNITRVVDALDEAASELKRFESSGRVMEVMRHVFVPERLTGYAIFKIPQTPRAPVFVTEDFRRRVLAAGLAGFRFDLVWEEGAREA
ncbi:MAG: imm11 family protein [Phycisphaerales bacterium]